MAELIKTSQLSKGIYITNPMSGVNSILSYTDVDELYIGNKKVKSVWSNNRLVWPPMNVSIKLTYNIILDCVAQMQLSIVLSSNIKDLQCRIDDYSCTSSSHTDSVTDIKAISTGKIYCYNNNFMSFQPCGVNLGTSSFSYKPTISVDYSVYNVENDIAKYYSTTINPNITFPTLSYTNYIYLRLYNNTNVSALWSTDYILLIGTGVKDDILGDQEYTLYTEYNLGSLGASPMSSNALPISHITDLDPYRLVSYNSDLVCFNKMLVCRIPRSKQCLVMLKDSEVYVGGSIKYNCLSYVGPTSCSSNTIGFIHLFYKVNERLYKRLCVISKSTNYVYGTLSEIKTL